MILSEGYIQFLFQFLLNLTILLPKNLIIHDNQKLICDWMIGYVNYWYTISHYFKIYWSNIQTSRLKDLRETRGARYQINTIPPSNKDLLFESASLESLHKLQIQWLHLDHSVHLLPFFSSTQLKVKNSIFVFFFTFFYYFYFYSA